MSSSPAPLRRSGGTARDFTSDFVQDSILADGAPGALNDEARHLVYLIADTGLRLSEAANLTAETIRLDHAVPHVQIRAIGRRLKTEQSARDIPLVDRALAAAKLTRQGRLAVCAGEQGDEQEGCCRPPTTVSTACATPSRTGSRPRKRPKVMADLIGRKWIRPKYGAGPSLE